MEKAIAEAIRNRRIAILAAILLIQKRKTQHNIVNKRESIARKEKANIWDTLIQELRLSNNVVFFDHTRLTLGQFDYLLSLVDAKLHKSNKQRSSIPSGARLAITLRHLATGDSLTTLSFAFKIGKSSACTIIKETCEILWDELSPIYLKFPAEKDWVLAAKDFERKWFLPHCVGSIEAKCVDIQSPSNPGDGSTTVLFAVSDANSNFICIDIANYDFYFEGGLLKESVFGNKLYAEQLQLPKPEKLNNSTLLPYYFVGNEDFPISKNLFRSYGDKKLDKDKRIFNYRLSLGNKCSENAFGILISRFQIFNRIINANCETVHLMVKSAVCLHNYIKSVEENLASSSRKYCPMPFMDRYDNEGSLILGEWRNNVLKNPGLSNIKQLGKRLGARNSTREVEHLRDTVKDYFLSSDGEIPWQSNILK